MVNKLSTSFFLKGSVEAIKDKIALLEFKGRELANLGVIRKPVIPRNIRFENKGSLLYYRFQCNMEMTCLGTI